MKNRLLVSLVSLAVVWTKYCICLACRTFMLIQSNPELDVAIQNRIEAFNV
jgi:hypothetical protein